MKRKPWTDDQVVLLEKHYPNMPMPELTALIGKSINQIYNKCFSLGLHRSAEYLASPAACRTNGRQGTGTRFEKGLTPWNKGLKGLDIGGEETRFKKGQKPPNHKPVGTTRVVDGYTEIKMADGMRQWKQLNRVIWERCNGPIPKGMNVIFIDKDRTNFEITNMSLVTKAENMRLNSHYNNYPKEISQLIQLRGALNRQINRREKHEQH